MFIQATKTMLIDFLQKLQVVSLRSTQTEKPRGEIKYSVLTVLIFMYIHCGEHFLKMNNHRRKGHRCAKVVHYGSGIIAFLTLVPIVMKSWQFPTLNDRLRHGSITQVWVRRLVGVGRWWAGVNWLLLKSVALPSLCINHSYYFQSF